MKDILFIVPLYYTPHFIDRFRQYLAESNTKYSYDIYLCCSNSSIADEARKKAEQYGYIFQNRENFGGGEGALWYAQNKSGIDFSLYKYIWYYEESCEPLRQGWIDDLIYGLSSGVGITGWDWHFEARKRAHQKQHKFTDAQGNIIIANENTAETGVDPQGNPFNMTWDTPGYRDETFVVSAKDFAEFQYPDASDIFWQDRNGVRGYGIRAERFWWDMANTSVHGFRFPSPNIQWHIFNKYKKYPSPYNKYFDYFRELPYSLRISTSYKPEPIHDRYLENIVTMFFSKLLRTINTIRKVFWYKFFVK